jgi:glycosyltransferase involved in cell wall biosynthesis
MSRREPISGGRSGARGASDAPRSRVAFVTSVTAWGGGEKWLVDTAAGLAARGHAVCVVARPGSDPVARALASGLRTYPLRLGGWLDPITLAELARILARERSDVCCVNLDKEIRLAGLASRLAVAGRRGQTSIRLVARRGSPDPIKNTWHYRLVYERLLDRLIVNCRALIAPVCDPAPWFDRRKVRVIPNGIDTAGTTAAASGDRIRRELGLAAERLVVVHVGEVGWRKGQEITLAAAAALRERFPEAVYLIAGEGGGRGELEQRAAALGLDDGTVRFLGFRSDAADILAAGDVVVLPTRREGFPNTLLEAMALGRPVLATRADGIPELVIDDETGLLVPVDDVSAFCEHLAELLAAPELRRRLGEAGRRRAIAGFARERVLDAVEDALCRW